MADNGLWFKLWCSVTADADMDNLDISDFGRWCKLGAYIKAHGTEGTVSIPAPARALCAMFQVDDFEMFHAAVSRLPNVQMRREKSDVSGETVAIVTFHNWAKYQGDLSTSRVRKFREMKRSRGEEMRREEKRREEILPQSPDSSKISVKDFVDSWNESFAGKLPAVEWPLARSRRDKVAARLEEHPQLAFWEKVFGNISKSKFLLGKSGKNGHEKWRCSLDWLTVNDTNCNKVFEGNYND